MYVPYASQDMVKAFVQEEDERAAEEGEGNEEKRGRRIKGETWNYSLGSIYFVGSY